VLTHSASDDSVCCGYVVVRYQVEVYTGSVENASTAASVYINVCADSGNTGRRALKKSLNNRLKFAVSQVFANLCYEYVVLCDSKFFKEFAECHLSE